MSYDRRGLLAVPSSQRSQSSLSFWLTRGTAENWVSAAERKSPADCESRQSWANLSPQFAPVCMYGVGEGCGGDGGWGGEVLVLYSHMEEISTSCKTLIEVHEVHNRRFLELF